MPDGNYGQVRYYLDRIDLSDPANPQLLTKINVPGVFFAASTDGQTIYTQDVTYTSDWSTRSTTWLNELTLQRNDTREAAPHAALAGYPGSAAINGEFAYLETWNWSASYEPEPGGADAPST